MSQIVLSKHVDTVIASSGGVGSSMLLTHLSQYRQTNLPSDDDGVKHSPLPPMTKHPQARFVYIFGDPRLATLSLFRRNYQHGHSRKLQRYQENPTGPVPKGISLDAYVAVGQDRLGFETHFDNWLMHHQVHQTLFLRYEAVHDNLDVLATFLELPKQAIATFPKRKERQSALSRVAAPTRQGLERLYGPFAARLAALDDVIIKERVDIKTMMRCYQTEAYQRAIRWQIRNTRSIQSSQHNDH
ncbi:MAG: hypothetical protein ACPG8W_15325 [Candidatus Promineifilaceae bacterium]